MGEFMQHEQYSYILDSQSAWRKLRRGVISRPQEIPGISTVLDESIKIVFSSYLDQARPTSIVAWSVLKDEPLEPLWGRLSRRRPEAIAAQDERAYLFGITELNEWAVDFATKYWFTHASQTTLVQRLGAVYANICTGTGQKLMYGHTYRTMEQIGRTVEARYGYFDDAVFRALFLHDAHHLNRLVSEAYGSRLQSLDQLALHLGKQQKQKTFTTYAIDSEAKQSTVEIDGLFKRTLESFVMVGFQDHPGVIELIVAQQALVFGAYAVATTAVSGDILWGVTSGTIGGTLASSLMGGYALIHEAIHDYSRDRMFNGLIPLTLVGQ